MFTATSNETAIANVVNNSADIAILSRELIGSEFSNLDRWRLADGLYAARPKLALRPRLAGAVDYSEQVRSDDWINFMRTTLTGLQLVAGNGYTNGAPSPWTVPYPDYDANLDGGASLGDLGAVSARWGQSQACKGWIRADVTNSGNVSLADTGGVSNRWGRTGYVAAQSPGAYDPAWFFSPRFAGSGTYYAKANVSALDNDELRRISRMSILSEGQETCNGGTQTDWYAAQSLNDEPEVSVTASGGYENQLWDCLIGGHILAWSFQAHWENAAASPENEFDATVCNLKETLDCYQYYP